MKLLLDIGNTRIKWAPWEDGRLGAGAAFERGNDWLPPLDRAPEQVWVASVAGSGAEKELAAATRERWNLEPWFARTQGSAMGLINSYREPSRMGVDRWLGMLAAWRRASRNVNNGAVCVVDAGSALTIDLVSAAGEHLGGYILPGFRSMERALLSDTDRVDPGPEKQASLDPGHNTGEAVYNGLLLAQAGAVNLALGRREGDFALLVTGGGGEALLRALEGRGEGAPDLVLEGLALAGNAAFA